MVDDVFDMECSLRASDGLTVRFRPEPPLISGVDSQRQITLRAGEHSTHVIVDITGYYR